MDKDKPQNTDSPFLGLPFFQWLLHQGLVKMLVVFYKISQSVYTVVPVCDSTWVRPTDETHHHNEILDIGHQPNTYCNL